MEKSETSEVLPRRALVMIGLLVVVNVFNYMDRVVLSVLLPQIKVDLALSDTQLGWLGGIAFAFFYAILGIPIARLADVWIRKHVVSISLAAWSLMTMLGGSANSFATLFLARMGVGVGEAGCAPASQSMIADLTTPDARSAAMGWYSAGTTVGVMIGLGLGGWLSGAIGWRWTLVVMGAPGLLLALVVSTLGIEPSRAKVSTTSHENMALATVPSAVNGLLRIPTFRHLLLAFGAAAFSNGLLQWLPSFYMRTFDLSPSETGILFGFAFGTGSTIGAIIGGYLAARLAKRNRSWLLWQPAIAFAMCAPFVVALCFSPSVEIAIAFNVLYTLLGGIGVAPLMAAVLSVAHPDQRAMAVALVGFAGSMLGTGLGPVIVGYISDLLSTAGRANSLQIALAITAVFPLWSALHLLWASRTFKVDFVE